MRFTKTIATAVALTVGALAFGDTADARARQERIWRPHHGWHGHHHHHHGGHFAAGAFGFAAGAILGSALSRPYYYAPAPAYVAPAPVYVAPAPVVVYQPWTPAWVTYCRGKYRSFNASTGYYLGYDGDYHFCR